MPMSQDRIIFRLPPGLFSANDSSRPNHMARSICIDLLEQAFSIDEAEARNLFKIDNGPVIKCRPSQFARFIALRHRFGKCINTIRDLDPRLVTGSDAPPDHMGELADATGFDAGVLSRVLSFLGLSAQDALAMHVMRAGRPARRRRSVDVDVSRRPNACTFVEDY